MLYKQTIVIIYTEHVQPQNTLKSHSFKPHNTRQFNCNTVITIKNYLQWKRKYKLKTYQKRFSIKNAFGKELWCFPLAAMAYNCPATNPTFSQLPAIGKPCTAKAGKQNTQ